MGDGSVVDVTRMRMLVVGSGATSEDALKVAVRDALAACSVAADGEALIVLELAWQRAAQARRAAALQRGADALNEERDHQIGRLRRLEALVSDDTVARYDGAQWKGPSEAVIAQVSAA